jgi:hypothetical protein
LLEEMSQAEGGPDHALNLEGLAEILATGRVPRPLGLWPGGLCEFLTLTVDLPAQEHPGQVIRLFASWVMLNAYAWPEREGHGITEQGDERRLLVLIQSSLALGPAFVRAAVRFVAWAQAQEKDTHDSVSDLFYLFTRLLLSAASPDAADVAAAPELYDELVANEQRIRRKKPGQHSPGWPESEWLFGLYHDFEPETFRREWVRAASLALDHLRASGSGELNPGLIELKERLAGEQAVLP